MTKRGLSFLAVVAFLFLSLAGCNTTDALTPQVDIPNGQQPTSQPVTQSDLDQMSNAQQPTVQMNAPQPAQTGTPQLSPDQTLDAQANRLNSQNQNVLAAPQSQTLQPPAQQQVQQTAPALQSATAGAGPTIRFLPIIGAPVESVTPLSRQLGAEAKSRGLVISAATDPNPAHILKGYLNAFTDGGKTTVVYVWDILDTSGARLHRIQGQGSIPVAAADPWTVVPATLMQQIATRTMNEYMTWRQTQ